MAEVAKKLVGIKLSWGMMQSKFVTVVNLFTLYIIARGFDELLSNIALFTWSNVMTCLSISCSLMLSSKML